MLDRRTFLQGLIAGTAGLLLPDRRVWALDRTMIAPSVGVVFTRKDDRMIMELEGAELAVQIDMRSIDAGMYEWRARSVPNILWTDWQPMTVITGPPDA
jgi:hypothetical protein